MLYFTEKSQQITLTTMRSLVDFLQAGKTLVLPTDTIYGFSCLATQARAVAQINRLKNRSAGKPFILLVANLAMLKKYTFVSAQHRQLLRQIWSPASQPVTVILKGRGLLPRIIEKPGEGLACRLPKSDFLIKILKTVNQPLVSTSLNISGQAPLLRLDNLEKIFSNQKHQPAAVLDIGHPTRLRPSKLLDIRDPQNIITLRA